MKWLGHELLERHRADRACRQARKLAALVAGRDVAAAEARALWAHLADCMECRRDYSGYLEVRSVLEAAQPEGATAAPREAAFFDRLQRDIMTAVEDGPPPPSLLRRWSAPTVMAAALVVAGLLFVPDAWLPGRSVSPMMTRDRMAPAPWPADADPGVRLLSHPVGLEAQRRLPDFEGPVEKLRVFVPVGGVPSSERGEAAHVDPAEKR